MLPKSAIRLATFFVAVVSLAFASSATVAQESEPTTPAPSPVLSPVPSAEPAGPEGAWDVTHFDAWGEGLVEPREDSELTLAMLTGGRLEGRTGCGDYHGGYSLEGERLGLGIVSKGFGECGRKKNEEAVAFSVALESVVSWRATPAGLELLDDSGGVRVALERPAFADVTGTWTTLRYTRASGEAATPLADAPIVLDLHADDRVTGSSGCRFLEGEYRREGSRIVIGPVEPIGPACTGDARKQERRLLSLFEQVALWERDADGLVLADAFGQPMLVLRPEPEEVPEAASTAAPDPSPAPDETGE